MAWSDEARKAAAEARAKAGEYKTKPLPSGKVGVFRSTGTLVAKFPNQASADNHVARQAAEDRDFRAAKVNNYLDERAARPPAPPAEPSPQLDLFSGEGHVHDIASQHGIDTSHLKPKG
jgi:hypothetical protein